MKKLLIFLLFLPIISFAQQVPWSGLPLRNIPLSDTMFLRMVDKRISLLSQQDVRVYLGDFKRYFKSTLFPTYSGTNPKLLQDSAGVFTWTLKSSLFPTNYVTTNTTQTISGAKTFNSNVTLGLGASILFVNAYGNDVIQSSGFGRVFSLSPDESGTLATREWTNQYKFDKPVGTTSQYVRGDGSLSTYTGGGGGTWGSITGTLSSQTDLNTALSGKFPNPTGTTSQYIRGDGTLATYTAGNTYTAGTGLSLTSNQFALDISSYTSPNNISINTPFAKSLSLQSNSTMTLTALNTVGHSITMNPGNNSINISSSTTGFKGLQYNADYTANFTARSLVDKGYVDAQVAAGGGGGGSSPGYFIKTSNYTAVTTSGAPADYIECSGTFTVTLPTATSIAGHSFYILNNGSGTITLTGTGGETIGGATTVTTSYPGASFHVVSNGTNYKIF